MVILLLQHEKQSYSYWEPENSEYLQQRSLHSEKQFDGEFASSGVMGPYYFDTSYLAAVTVTSEHYLDMLRNFCEPE